MTKKKIVIIIAVLVFLIPFPTTQVPEWTIIVIDEHSKPYPNKLVRQFCMNYSLGADACIEKADQETDINGKAVFPKRIIIMSFGSRILFSSINFVGQLAHGSFGSESYVDASGPQGYKVLKYSDSIEQPTKFILPSNRIEQ